MKTYTKMLLMLALFVFGTTNYAYAQEDPIMVTFLVNTSTVADTLSADGVLQIRGSVNGEEFSDEGYFGQNINWGSTSIMGENIDGDYWKVDVLMAPGDELVYKFWVGHSIENGAGFNDGWEFNFDGDGDNYTFTVPEDATEDIETDLQFFAGFNDGRQPPFESVDGQTAVFFRVNVANPIALGQFDPEDESNLVGVRGLPEFFGNPADWSATAETSYLEQEPRPAGSANVFFSGAIYVDNDIIADLPESVPYKFVLEVGSEVTWESGNDRFLDAPTEGEDITVRWDFFDRTPPPSGDLVTANVEFQANVSLLEALGYFNRGIGDQVAVPGAFNGWDSATPMTYDEGADVWRSTFELTREVGQPIPFKYFIIWDDSRFDEESENYIPNLNSGNGWEEPGSTGGGDRIFTFGSETSQIAQGDFGGDIGFFNSIPEQALITVDGTGSETYPVTFTIDMTAALENDGQPFDPENDEVFLVVETPIFGLTQNLSVGDNQPGLGNPEERDRLRFEPTEEDNIWTLTLDLLLPTENHFGFNIAFENEAGERVLSGPGGFSAGRRYYRYITPEAVLGNITVWPAGGYDLAMAVWSSEALDFPTPPDYGLGVNIDEPSYDTPRAISLGQNYPNPFNPTTNINFTLPENADVRLDVFNVLGQRVATLANGTFSSGTHTVQFDASRLSSGVYLYRLQSGGMTISKSMMLVK